MAVKNQFNVYTTFYERFLALSVSIKVDEHQLKMETPSSSQAPVLRCKDINGITTEYLKESLSAVCPLLGAHNVARVRQGTSLPLVELDFTDERALKRFCESLSARQIQCRLEDRLKKYLFVTFQKVEVTLKLYLIMPNADKRRPPLSREVTTANYQECFSLIRASILFEFGAIDIVNDGITDKAIQQFGIGDLGELVQELKEVAAHWLILGISFKIAHCELEVIRKDHSGDNKECFAMMLATWLKGIATPSALVQSLVLNGWRVLAWKLAIKYGVTITKEDEAKIPEEVDSDVAGLNTLACQRQEIIAKDAQCQTLDEQLIELNEKKVKIMEILEQGRLSIEVVMDRIEKLKHEQASLYQKRTEKRNFWFSQRSPTNKEEDLLQLTCDTEKDVSDLSIQINKLEEMIKSLNDQVAQVTLQLVQKEQEKKHLENKIDKIQIEKRSLEKKIEAIRTEFETELQRILDLNEKLKDELYQTGTEVDLTDVVTTKQREEQIPSAHDTTIDEEEWYFGSIERSKAEVKCRNTGYYLVRYSNAQSKYVLTVNWNGNCIHFKIEEIPDPKHSGISFYCIETKCSRTIRDLLNYYVKEQIPVTRKSGVILTKFVSRSNDWTDSFDGIELQRKIGSGVFGDIHEGLLTSRNEKVAVKSCQFSADRNLFLQEADILKQYEHLNIVRLIGVVTNPLYIIMEFMPGKSLHDFLRKKDATYTKLELALMCVQVCSGMAYLEKNNYVHRNLAARNCLVDENNFVKISGFGLNREGKDGTRMVLVKWTAPEALNYGKFTSASDVWSFSILMWETFSLGTHPYQDLSNKQAREKVETGYRMAYPVGCPQSLNNVMFKCWQYDKEDRPTFAQLYPLLNNLCPDISN